MFGNSRKSYIKGIAKMFLLIAMVIYSLQMAGYQNTQVNAITQVSYYVDPVNGNDNNNGLTTANAFRTITKARDVVRTVNTNMTGDIYVYLRGGTYNLTSKITFGTADSGTNGYKINYKAYNSETPVISSQYNVTGWSLYDAGKNIYRASVGSRQFRQIYVNEVRGIRARYPNTTNESTGEPYFKILNNPNDSSGNAQPIVPPFQISASEIGTWANDANVEFNWIAHWSDFKSHVSSYSVNGSVATVNISNTSSFWGYTHHWQSNPYYYWENSYTFLDAQGEWYLDKTAQMLYYIPRSGENMSTAQVAVPTLETLFEVTGSVENVALNKTATASSYVAGCEPSKAVDGSTSTRWYAQNSGDKWLKIDLGQSYTINRYLVKHASKNGDISSVDTKNFKLQSSNNGNSNWTDIDIIDNSNDSTMFRNCDPETGRVGNFTARYIRLYITAPTQTGAPDTYARIQELQFLRYTYAKDIQFSGLQFKYSNWTTPDTNGYSSAQAGYVIENNNASKYYNHSEAWEPVPAMFSMKYTQNILVEKNKFMFAGAIAIKSSFESDHDSFIGNLVDTCAGGGIYVGAGDYWYDGRTHASSRYTTISNNYITDCGLDYKDSQGVFATFPQNLTIEYNEIQNLPEGAISVGWVWDDKDLYGATNVEIRYNRIHNIMRFLDDNGGIYSPGRITNMNVHDNYIFNLPVSKYQGNADFGGANAGLYFDNGSCYKVAQYNVVNNTGLSMYASNLPSYNNTFQYNYYNGSMLPKVSNKGTSANHDNIITNNTKVSGQSWPTAATNIMIAANIQTAYRGIIPAKNEQGVGSDFEHRFLTSLDFYTIATGEYIVSPSRNCYMTLENNGNFVMYDGAPGSTSTKIWETNSVDTNSTYTGKHFITLDSTGYLNIWRGVGPYDNQGLFWNEYIGTDNSSYKQKGITLYLTDSKNMIFASGSSTDFLTKWQTDRSFLTTGAYIRQGQFITSPSRTCFVVLQTDGNLCLYSGTDPAHNTGLIWSSGVTSTVGNYFAIMQSDGNLAIYKGTGPSDNQGFLWSPGLSLGTSSYFTTIQDDLHISIYEGTGPSDNRGLKWMKP